MRAARSSKAAVQTVEAVTPRSITPLVDITTRQLEAAGQLDTVLGQQAVRLAEKMGASMDTGSATAAVSRELRAVMAEALADAAQAVDPLDELKARRDRKRAG